MKKAKKWHNINLMTRNNSEIFENNKGEKCSYKIVAKADNAGDAYKIADYLKTIYNPDLYFIVVD